MNSNDYCVGIDVGTSGCRVIAIDADRTVLSAVRSAFPQGRESTTDAWRQAVFSLLQQTIKALPSRILQSLCVDATSSTLLLCRPNGQPITPALMYHDQTAAAQLPLIQQFAPLDVPVHSATSSLAKFLYLRRRVAPPYCAVHQADWILGLLCGQFNRTDENNALKFGYDVNRRCWPDWLRRLDIDPQALPQVTLPGTPISTITTTAAQQLNLSYRPLVCAGTTDSTAAFLATGAHQSGDAVTSLGSTLVLKLLCDTPIHAPALGVYSHRLHDRWLVGGASNSGGNVIAQLFSADEIAAFSAQMQPEQPTGYAYYPLTQPGERFPMNDPTLAPILDPKPAHRAIFFQAVLEGITRIEKQGYEKLVTLGANPPERLFSVGGGSRNQPWMQLRARQLNIPMQQPLCNEAAFGAALLAKQGCN